MEASSSIESSSFDAFNSKLQASALKATRSAAGLPADIAFHRSIDAGFAKDIDAFSSRVLSLTNKLLNLVATADESQGSKGKGKAKLQSQDDVVDNFHSLVVDSMDQLLERTDICLDEFLGRHKPPAIAINPPIARAERSKKEQKQHTAKGYLDPALQHASHLPKPQLNFKRKPDNSDAPWYPTISHKYNAKVPLGHVYHDLGSDGVVGNHPYRYEISHLSYPPRLFTPCTPQQPPSLEDTSAIWVSTPQEVQTMLAKLKHATELAVDLEHHSYRSYNGFLCLMQISDRENDWIVDLLALREEIEQLNEVFTDPKIVKVLHGAESDVVWLQQDFNVYIVNLFDTFHASKLLDFPRHGLANLLEMYCDYVPDKRYQLADWRIRPLPQEMLDYARSDTHFLLFIYDNLLNALIDRSQSRSSSPSTSSQKSQHALLTQVLTRSAETSLRVYAKEPYDAADGSGPGGWDTLAKKWNKGALMAGGPGVGIGAMQREVYVRVHGWRERVSREEDESTRYTMPNQYLFQLAEQPPADMAALLGVFKSSVPAIVRRRAKELLEVIREGVRRGLEGKQATKVDEESNKTESEVILQDAVGSEKVMEVASTPVPSHPPSSQTLWGITQPSSSTLAPLATRSFLFGSTIPTSLKTQVTPGNASSYTTSTSALFGSILTKPPGSSSLKQSYSETPQFRQLVARITSTMVIVPSVPKIVANDTPPSTMTGDTKVEDIDAHAASGMQVEIPYVPAAQRQTTIARATVEERDTIVMVGQKKRKRVKGGGKAKAEGDGGEDTPSPSVNENKGASEGGASNLKAEEAPFDFSAVPNILDDNPDAEDGNRKKKRQKKQNKGGTFYGDFPAPPKAHSELKSGNQSYTFK